MPHETRSTCPYCGVGCGVIIESQGDRITGVRGDPDHPANFGRLCSKGSTLHLTAAPHVAAQARLLQPMQRLSRDQAPRPLGWDAALDLGARRLADIVRQHGPDSLGIYVSGQLLTEDYYAFNKLAKGLLGTNNIDTNSRLCMSSAVAGYKLTLGSDAPPTCYEDVREADCLLIAGSNTAWAHPVLYRRIEEARQQRPEQKIVVVDPRRTETAAAADLFVQILPGTDVALFHGMLHLMLWEGWVDHDFIAKHTGGFDALKALVREYTPERVTQLCGIPRDVLLEATRLFATSRNTLSLYCQGLNQSSSGTAKNAALINLHLAAGQIARPGAGPFSLTGQPNAMGGREVGGMANLLSAHRDLSNPQHRAEVAALWGIDRVPETPGKTALEMFEAAADGEIKSLWIVCTNPAQSLPDQATVRRALQRAEFVIVQEAYAHTATCDHADLLLPATTWGEKDGTVTNSERRISRVRPAVPAPGQTRHDWRIACDLALRLQAQGLGPSGLRMDYANAEAIWNEHRESTRGRDLDITGLDYAQLEAAPQQWPQPEGQRAGRERLYQDRVFATRDGRARFASIAYTPVAEVRDARYPFSLGTGRLRDQWHGMSRTGTLGRLFGHVPEPSVELNPGDMQRRQLRDGDLVHVTSRRGSIVLPAQASNDVASGQAWIAMHWGPEYLGGSSSTGEPLAGVNALTSPARCPSSRQPELKHAAVKVLKAELPWRLIGMAWLAPDQALAAREALRRLMPRFAYASCVPFAAPSPLETADQASYTGVLFRAAAHEPAPPECLREIEACLGLDQGATLRYADPKRGQHRAARMRDQADVHAAPLQAVLLAGDTQAESWIRTLLQQEAPARPYGRQLLSPVARPPQELPARARQVCTCLNVGEDAITRHLRQTGGDAGTRLASLQQALRCGTQCGSCVPELKRLVMQLEPEATPG